MKIHHIYIYDYHISIIYIYISILSSNSMADTQGLFYTVQGQHPAYRISQAAATCNAANSRLCRVKMSPDVSRCVKYVCMYVLMNVCMHVCMCMCMSMSMSMYMYTCKCIYIYKLNMWVHVYVYTIIVCLNAMNWHQWSSLGIVKSMKYPLKHVLVALHCPAGIAMAVT